MNNDGVLILNFLKQLGMSDHEARDFCSDVVRKTDEAFLGEIMSRLTAGEADELSKKLRGVSDVLEKNELVRRACGNSVNKPNFGEIGQNVSLRVWQEVLGSWGGKRKDDLKKVVEEYLASNQELAKKVDQVLAANAVG